MVRKDFSVQTKPTTTQGRVQGQAPLPAVFITFSRNRATLRFTHSFPTVTTELSTYDKKSYGPQSLKYLLTSPSTESLPTTLIW